MKTVWVMRHAKSDWSNEGQADHERTLNDRGRRTAPRMGQVIRDAGASIDLILCSTATRTRETCALVVEAAGLTCPIEYCEPLYLCLVNEFSQQLRRLPETVSSVLIVAHNPGLQELIGEWTRAPHSVPTATLARFELSIDQWNAASLQQQTGPFQIWRPSDFGLGGND